MRITVKPEVLIIAMTIVLVRLDIHHGTKAGQGTRKYVLQAEFIDAEQMSVQELMVLIDYCFYYL